jgi:hypothetical protein
MCPPKSKKVAWMLKLKMRMQDCNTLLFYQLLFPIGDPKRSGVKGDVLMPYYTDVMGFMHIYGASKFGMTDTYTAINSNLFLLKRDGNV